jgi:hypothetical protein
MAIGVWLGILAAVILFAGVATRMTAEAKDEGLSDAGLVIVEFGRAFPTEAIRQMQKTADGEAVFLRLHDNKAGMMRNLRKRFACHLIEPGRVRVSDTGREKGLDIEFLDAPHHNGTFEFTSPEDAAEVSLWLLGNYVSDKSIVPPEAGLGPVASA